MSDFFKKETVVAAILTGFSYFVAFQFRSGYLSYFGVPDDFIIIDIKGIIIAFVSICSALGVAYVILEAVVLFIPKEIVYRKDIIVAVIFLIFLVVSLRGERDLITWTIFLGIWFFFVVFSSFGPPMIKKMLGSKEKFEDLYLNYNARESRIRSASPLMIEKVIDNLAEKEGHKMIQVVIFLSLLSINSQWFGVVEARTSEQFLTVSLDGSKHLVITEYKDSFLVTPFVEENKVKKEFYIKDKKDIKNKVFILEKQGPIEVQSSE